VLGAEVEETHVDVFGQEFVGNAVFVNNIVVQSSAADGSSREESEDTGKLQCQSWSRDGVLGSASRMGRGRSWELQEAEAGRCTERWNWKEKCLVPSTEGANGLADRHGSNRDFEQAC